MKPIKRMQPALGTFVEIGVVPELGGAIEQAITRAFARISLIQSLLSFHDPRSELSQLNCAGGKFISCHPLTLRCFKLAKIISRLSSGLFNCTLGVSAIHRGALPLPEGINAEVLLASGDENDICIEANRIRLQRPVLVTLDGIAKGFAIDTAVLTLKVAGIKHGWINAGGDIRVFGECVLPLVVRDHRGKQHALGGLKNAAIATSTSQSTPEFPGILLSSQGAALEPGTWSVLANRAWLADALTKVAANLPVEKRVESLAVLGGRWISLNENGET